ncbi:MAG: hypothetical protein ACPF8V_09320 [Luteibaculum sp.]
MIYYKEYHLGAWNIRKSAWDHSRTLQILGDAIDDCSSVLSTKKKPKQHT